MRFVWKVAAFLAVYNNATNLAGLPEGVYVPMNLAAAGGLTGLALRRGYRPATLGLGREGLRPGLRWGGGAALLVAAGLLAAGAVPGLRPLLGDARVAGLGPAGLTWTVLVRIPLGTALWEEVAFRGVLYGAWARHRSPAAAAVGSSAVFGIWHIGPTVATLRENDVPLDAAGVAAVGGSVVGTAVAGLVFCWLRQRGRGVLAPFLAHVATNSFGTLAAWVAQR